MEDYKKENDPNDEIKLAISEELGKEAIVRGKVDASAYPVLVFDDMKKECGLPIKQVGEPLYEEHNAYPFLKDSDDELFNKFNEALKS
ncbi:hypothetical protein RFZ45_05940, partial [Acinetobacter baumannii]|nr:hypothetical protein [Acinetobacter baumannii]